MKPFDEDEDGQGPSDRGGSFVPDFVRRMAVAGLGAVFMTEEGIRSLAGQLKLPKELLGFIVQQADKTKAEVGRVLSEEIRRFLQSDLLREEFMKLLAGTTIEVKAEVRLLPARKHGGAIKRAEERQAEPEPERAPERESAPEPPARAEPAGPPPNVSPSVAEELAPKVVVTHVGTRRSKKGPKRE